MPGEGSGSATTAWPVGLCDGHPAVDGDVGVAAEDQPVGELGDGDGGTRARWKVVIWAGRYPSASVQVVGAPL